MWQHSPVRLLQIWSKTRASFLCSLTRAIRKESKCSEVSLSEGKNQPPALAAGLAVTPASREPRLWDTRGTPAEELCLQGQG